MNFDTFGSLHSLTQKCENSYGTDVYITVTSCGITVLSYNITCLLLSNLMLVLVFCGIVQSLIKLLNVNGPLGFLLLGYDSTE